MGIFDEIFENFGKFLFDLKFGLIKDNEINGITPCSRLLGRTFLYPSVIPEPFVAECELGEPDEFLIIASRGLWEKMSYVEAVKRVRYIPNPILAAKHLQVDTVN